MATKRPAFADILNSASHPANADPVPERPALPPFAAILKGDAPAMGVRAWQRPPSTYPALQGRSRTGSR